MARQKKRKMMETWKLFHESPPPPVWIEGWNEEENVSLLGSNILIEFRYAMVSGGLRKHKLLFLGC